MPESAPAFDSRGIARRILPLAAIIVLVGAAYLASGGVSLESLVRHRAAIDDFVLSHRLLAVLSYIVTVALSVPGAVFLTVTGGFLFGLVLGASAAVINATIGATLIFLAARTALGDRCCGAPVRARTSWPADFVGCVQLSAFSAPRAGGSVLSGQSGAGLAGVRLGPFNAATAIGIIPGAIVFAVAAVGLDSMIVAQKNSYDRCIAAGGPIVD
jgi:uncharacterized membrane protein YdjX (TVP38/TMEM64 family)